MKEIKLLAVLLAALLAAAWVSWTREDTKDRVSEATVLAVTAKEIQGITLVTRTQTVSLALQAEKDPYWMIDVYSATSTRAFVGNDQVAELLKNFAPFSAIRSLGKSFGETELGELELTHPQRRLELKLAGGTKVFDLGGRTYGARDHYVRARGGSEVFLVGNKVLGDLEYPEGRYMQRKLFGADLKDVEYVTVSAGGKLKKILRKNRLSPEDAFWADDAAPDVVSETLGNYIDKVDKLSIQRYGTEAEPVSAGEAVVELTWHAPGGEVLEQLTLTKTSTGAKSDYAARSNATRRFGELLRSAAEQLERDLGVVFAN